MMATSPNEYIVAPVTIDNDEYIYAYCYYHAKKANDSARMEMIKKRVYNVYGARI